MYSIRHKCKLCFKCFPNGRALGGHMRSHMMNLQVPLKEEFAHQTVMSGENESASSASYSDDEESGNLLSYGLRENPKKSFRLVDPQFLDAGSVVVQDRESETETSMNLTRRRRSKRTRKSSTLVFKNQEQAPHDDQLKRLSCAAEPEHEHEHEPEPVSSISDATTEEDIAYCLMMLSRDKWKENQVKFNYEDQEYDDDDDDDDEDETEEQKMSSKSRSRGKYKCETCNKVFRSYQALGGHRASHKKIKFSSTTQQVLEKVKNAALLSSSSSSVSQKKIHECPFCSRVFNSGQALGGHKRSHFTNGGGGRGLVLASATASATTEFGEHLIDLNLPAPIDGDEFSHVEISAVSDAEFINPIRE